MCAEKVERLISIDCWSPMSASTRSKTGSAARRGRRAQAGLVEQRREAERLQRDGLAAGVRPADDERAQRAEVEVDRHRRRRVEQRMPRAEQPHLVRDLDRRAAPARARASRRRARGRSRPPPRRAATSASRAVADRAPRARAGSARPPRARRPRPRSWRLFSSTISNGSTKSVWPGAGGVVDDAAARCAARSPSARAPAGRRAG